MRKSTHARQIRARVLYRLERMADRITTEQEMEEALFRLPKEMRADLRGAITAVKRERGDWVPEEGETK